MNDNEYWLRIWGLASAVAIVFALVFGAVTVNSDAAIVSMVERGADPIMARCAIYGADRADSAAMCALAVNQKSEVKK